MSSDALIAAGVLCAITAAIHSLLGEKRLIGPILASGIPLMQSPLARGITRFAWHWTSVLWLCVGAVLVSAGTGSFVDRTVLLAIALAHIFCGLFDAVLTRGKHIGWPFITLIGALTLFALIPTR